MTGSIYLKKKSEPTKGTTPSSNQKNIKAPHFFRSSSGSDRTKAEDNTFDNSKEEKEDNSGTYADTIGIGEHAKTNVIWHVISTTLVIFSCISCALIVCNIFKIGTKDLTDNIKDIWGIITPIITLSLGYLFGKIERKEDKEKISG